MRDVEFVLLGCLAGPQRPSVCCTGNASRTILVVIGDHKWEYTWHDHPSTRSGSELQGNTGCPEAPNNLCGSSAKPEVRLHLFCLLQFLERMMHMA